MEKETIQLRIDATRCWHEERARLTVIGSFLGALVLTSQRLVFLSCGGSKVSWRVVGLMRGFVEGFPRAFVRVGTARTKDLDLSDLSKAGSFQVPLGKIVACETRKRWDRSYYLSICFQDEAGNSIHRAFMTESGLEIGPVRAMEDAVREANSNLAQSA